jgi:hypothetical protein
MPRVKYTYDGSTGTETTEDFSAGEETAQDTADSNNITSYKANAMEVKISMNDNMRSMMEVI